MDGLSLRHLGRNGNAVVARESVEAERIAEIDLRQRGERLLLAEFHFETLRREKQRHGCFDLLKQIARLPAVRLYFQMGLEFALRVRGLAVLEKVDCEPQTVHRHFVLDGQRLGRSFGNLRRCRFLAERRKLHARQIRHFHRGAGPQQQRRREHDGQPSGARETEPRRKFIFLVGKHQKPRPYLLNAFDGRVWRISA
jgi:hypothetical protein